MFKKIIRVEKRHAVDRIFVGEYEFFDLPSKVDNKSQLDLMNTIDSQTLPGKRVSFRDEDDIAFNNSFSFECDVVSNDAKFVLMSAGGLMIRLTKDFPFLLPDAVRARICVNFD